MNRTTIENIFNNDVDGVFIPLNNIKEPLTTWKNKTRDELKHDIDKLLDENKTIYGLGWVIPENTIVLDFDVYINTQGIFYNSCDYFKSFIDWSELHTKVVKTGSNGRHIYFHLKQMKDLPRKYNTDNIRIDIQKNGYYVITPKSIYGGCKKTKKCKNCFENKGKCQYKDKSFLYEQVNDLPIMELDLYDLPVEIQKDISTILKLPTKIEDEKDEKYIEEDDEDDDEDDDEYTGGKIYNLTIEQWKEFINTLEPLSDGSYDIWNTTMMCLFNIFEKCPERDNMIHDFSSLSTKYNRRETQAKINSYKDNLKFKYKLKKLLTLCSEHDIDTSIFKRTKSVKSLEEILIHSDFCDSDFGYYFLQKNPNSFVYYNEKFYQFKGHVWCEIDIDVLANLFLSYVSDFEPYIPLYKQKLKEIKHNSDISDDDKEEQSSMYKILLSGVYCIIKSLKGVRTKKLYIEDVRQKISHQHDPFDKHIELIGFTNGVYNLNTQEFRDGRFNDYILNSGLDYDYTQSDQSKREELMKFLTQIMPIEEELNLLLMILATGLYGQTLDKIVFLTGEGGNGKDTLINYLVKKTLGKLYYRANTSIITEKIKDVSVGISNMNKKRLVVYNEPPKHSNIKTAIVKEMTGCDMVSYRTIYSKITDVCLEGTHLILCNQLPCLDEAGEAIKRRLICIPFRSLFRSEEDKKEFDDDVPYLYVGSKYYISTEFTNLYKQEMMCILLDHFKKYRENNYELCKIPQSCKDLAKEYLQSSDEFYGWFSSMYHLYEDEKSDYIRILKLKDVYTNFKQSEFYNDMPKKQKRIFNYEKLVKEVSKNPTLRRFYKETYQPLEQGKRVFYRNVLLNWGYKQDESAYEE